MSSDSAVFAIRMATLLIQLGCTGLAFRILLRQSGYHRWISYLLVLSLPLALAHAFYPNRSGALREALCGTFSVCLLMALWVLKGVLDRRRAQDAVTSHGLAFHRSVFADSAIPLGVFSLQSSRIVACNQALADVLGYASIEAVMGLTVGDFSPPRQEDGQDSLMASKEHLQECLVKGSMRFLWKHQRPDGRLWDANVHLMKVSSNGDTYFEFTLQDVTESLALEQAHRQDQVRLKALNGIYERMDASEADLIQSILEEALALTESQGGYFHILSLEDGTILETHLSKNLKAQSLIPDYRGLHPEKAGLWADAYRRREVVIHNDFQKRGGEHNLPEGHVPILRHMSVPVFEGDRIVILVGVGNKPSDYTEQDGLQLRNLMAAFWNVLRRKKVEEQLKESEARWHFAMESAGDGLWDWDLETGKTYHSERWLAMLGEEGHGGDISGVEAWRERLHPEDRAAASEAIEKHLRGETDAYVSEYRMRRRDGSYSWILDRGRIVKRSEDGRPLRMIGTHTDTSERKRAEQSLADARKMESLAVLAGGIAHDFNNIFTGVLGSVEIAELTLDEGAPEFKHLERIRSAILKASCLSRQMLAFSGMGRFVIEPIELNQLIRAHQEALKALVDKDIPMGWDLADINLMLEGDPSQIQQMLEALVSNAKESMQSLARNADEREPRYIRVSTFMQVLHQKSQEVRFFGETFKPGLYICLRVEDQGCGIPPENLERLFEPFFTTKFVGRGMSLAVVQGILRAHGGGVGVESQPGLGAAFTLYFPVSEAMVEIKTEVQEAVSQTCTHILLVEDDEMLRDVLSGALKSKGFEVMEAEDGLAAVALYQVHWRQICVVFMDLAMPKMDGHAAFLAMKQINPEARVVMTSGYSEGDVVEPFKNQGLEGFLSKPYQLGDVIALLEKLMGRASSSAE